MSHEQYSEYLLIRDFYGERKARRSQVPLINHINEGIEILKSIKASEEAIKAYCLHPVFQADADLEQNSSLAKEQDPYVMMLTMEYRQTANAYLSHRTIKSLDDIALSPLKEVNDMLIADKIQNFKDFMKYHYDTHERSQDLHRYFKNWFDKLGIPALVFDTLQEQPNELPLQHLG